MSKNKCWGIDNKDNRPVRVCLLVSRNKDNKNIENFVERRRSFVTSKSIKELLDEFNDFVRHGVNGEMCRMYLSVNARDPKLVNKELVHYLIDNPETNPAHLSPRIAGIAAKKECALEKKWMFDLDMNDESTAKAVCQDIKTFAPDVEIERHKTPHGYAIIVSHGFDTRQLIDHWEQLHIDITLKRDDLLCVSWRQTELTD